MFLANAGGLSRSWSDLKEVGYYHLIYICQTWDILGWTITQSESKISDGK